MLFDAGAQLAAVAAVRDLENRLREGADHAAADTLHRLVDAAGATCTSGGVEAGQWPAWERTYCMPSVGASALLTAAAASLDAQQPPQVVRGNMDCVMSATCCDQQEPVHIHKLAVQAAVRGAVQQLHRYQSRLGPYVSRARTQVPRPDWSTGAAVRTALVALANAYSTLTDASGGEVQATAASALLECTEQVLNTFAAALTALPADQQVRAWQTIGITM